MGEEAAAWSLWKELLWDVCSGSLSPKSLPIRPCLLSARALLLSLTFRKAGW